MVRSRQEWNGQGSGLVSSLTGVVFRLTEDTPWPCSGMQSSSTRPVIGIADFQQKLKVCIQLDFSPRLWRCLQNSLSTNWSIPAVPINSAKLTIFSPKVKIRKSKKVTVFQHLVQLYSGESDTRAVIRWVSLSIPLPLTSLIFENSLRGPYIGKHIFRSPSLGTKQTWMEVWLSHAVATGLWERSIASLSLTSLTCDEDTFYFMSIGDDDIKQFLGKREVTIITLTLFIQEALTKSYLAVTVQVYLEVLSKLHRSVMPWSPQALLRTGAINSNFSGSKR